MLHLADISEFQGTIDWPIYGQSRPAVIVRAHNGARPDRQWAANRDGSRANVRIRGFYQYLSKSTTPETQAAGFCNTIGDLRPGEFVAIDVEEGSGSQVARAQAWMSVVDQRLGTVSWLYSGEAFARAHLGSLVPFSARNKWIANYRTRPPDLPFTLWQHTDAERHPGVRNPCDCSIFMGSVDDLARIVGVVPSPQPSPLPPVVTFPEDHLMRVPVQLPMTSGGSGYWELDGAQAPPKPGDDPTGYPRPAVPFASWTGARPTVNGQYHKAPPNPEPAVTVCESDGGFCEIGFSGFPPNATPLIFLETAS